MWPFRHRNGRAIFKYHDGQRSRRIDPIVAMRAMDQHAAVKFESLGKDLQNSGPDAFKLIGEAAGAMREIFGLPKFEDGGLTELETLELFGKFDAYCEGLKKNTSPTPSLPPPTIPAVSDESTMPCVADSGSTQTAPN